MDWRGAVQVVLREASAPMHYTEIAQQIAERGLRKDDELGATPATTVVAIIVGSLKNDGTSSPFVRTARGYYGLRTEEQSQNIEEDLPETTLSPIRGIINAVGMFWERSKVQWESRPRILGQQQAGATPVDFCDQKGVYLLHDAQGVVYVGRVTDQNLGRRLFQHVLDRLSGRWTRFSWFGVYPVSNKGLLETNADFSGLNLDVVISTMEAVLIEGLEPRQNRRRGDDFQAVEFLQFEDPEIERARKQAAIRSLASQL